MSIAYRSCPDLDAVAVLSLMSTALLLSRQLKSYGDQIRLISITTETAVVDKPAEAEDDGHGHGHGHHHHH